MEFAVVAPIFFLLVFGLIEYGRMVMVQQLITNASREGARQAVLDGSTTADVESVVSNYLVNAGISNTTVTISPSPPSSAANGDPVTVVVQVAYDDVSWMPPVFLGNATLTATSVMRRESVN